MKIKLKSKYKPVQTTESFLPYLRKKEKDPAHVYFMLEQSIEQNHFFKNGQNYCEFCLQPKGYLIFTHQAGCEVRENAGQFEDNTLNQIVDKTEREFRKAKLSLVKD